MIIYIIVGIIAVFLCSLVKDKKRGLQWAFAVITVFLSIRYMWGNDYPGYLSSFEDYNNCNFGLFDYERSSQIHRHSHNEFGWIFLNRLFGYCGMGFFGLIIVTTIFECWVVYHMLDKYVTPKYYWVAVLLWFFSTSFCVNASMMRQYFCICIYLLVIDLMIEKKGKKYLWISVGLILLCMTIHRSSVILFTSLPLFYLRISKSNKIWIIVLGCIFLLWQVYGQSIIEPYISLLLESSEDYEEYMLYVGANNTSITTTGLGVIFRYIMFIVWLLLIPQLDKRHQPIVILLLLSYFFEVIATIAPVASRLGLYYSFLSMVCWTNLFEKAKQKPILYLFFGVQVILVIHGINQFFLSPLWGPSFFQYQTIFSAPSWM